MASLHPPSDPTVALLGASVPGIGGSEPGQKWQPSKLEVIRIQFFGRDLDTVLQKRGLRLDIIPQIISIGYCQFDLLVAESGLQLLRVAIKPADNRNKDNEATEIFCGERLTKEDPLVRYLGRIGAIKKMQRAYGTAHDESWDQTKPFLAQLVQSLEEFLLEGGS